MGADTHQDDRDSLQAAVERTVYHDPRTRYTVLRIRIPGEASLLTAVGRSDGAEDGAALTFTGRWGEHPSHGRQFQFDYFRAETPKDIGSIRRRLMRYPGVREVMARRIVEKFGLKTLEIMTESPRLLLEIEGLGPKSFERMMDYHASQVGPRVDVENRLIELSLPPRLADAIHKKYKFDALRMLEQHPYVLAREVKGIGFTTADRIARALGVDLESNERADAGVLHTLERAASEGHCALPYDHLCDQARGVLGIENDPIRASVDRLIAEGDLIVEDSQTLSGEVVSLCFRREVLFAEQNVARCLSIVAAADKEHWDVGELPDHLSDGQREAVHAIAKTGVVALTGGPGTGKSTVMKHVIELAQCYEWDLLLAAPTGRAAKRLEQTTGEPAKTVHRLLGIQGNTNEFTYHANNPLPPGLVVIDETSMLDLQLAEALFSALTTDHRLMLVGDADQLPSVGPGNVLRDVIEANEGQDSSIPVVRLDTIFRQAEGSSIVVNAHHIQKGESLTPDENGSKGEFFVVATTDPARVQALIVRMATERIPKAYGVDPISDIQVLCPMHKGRTGTEQLNLALQREYTGDADSITVASGPGGEPRTYRLGDRVMQTRNDYDRNVFNGDIGTVVEVRADVTKLIVEIDGARVVYEYADLSSLQLAYAISIHKSQGSEFPVVVMPILGEHHVMLRRNLLYTAATRARSLCVIVGDPRAIERAIRRGDAAHRYTGLASRLRVALAVALGDTVYEPPGLLPNEDS